MRTFPLVRIATLVALFHSVMGSGCGVALYEYPRANIEDTYVLEWQLAEIPSCEVLSNRGLRLALGWLARRHPSTSYTLDCTSVRYCLAFAEGCDAVRIEYLYAPSCTLRFVSQPERSTDWRFPTAAEHDAIRDELPDATLVVVQSLVPVPPYGLRHPVDRVFETNLPHLPPSEGLIVTPSRILIVRTIPASEAQ